MQSPSDSAVLRLSSSPAPHRNIRDSVKSPNILSSVDQRMCVRSPHGQNETITEQNASCPQESLPGLPDPNNDLLSCPVLQQEPLHSPLKQQRCREEEEQEDSSMPVLRRCVPILHNAAAQLIDGQASDQGDVEHDSLILLHSDSDSPSHRVTSFCKTGLSTRTTPTQGLPVSGPRVHPWSAEQLVGYQETRTQPRSLPIDENYAQSQSTGLSISNEQAQSISRGLSVNSAQSLSASQSMSNGQAQSQSMSNGHAQSQSTGQSMSNGQAERKGPPMSLDSMLRGLPSCMFPSVRLVRLDGLLGGGNSKGKVKQQSAVQEKNLCALGPVQSSLAPGIPLHLVLDFRFFYIIQ